MPSPKSVSPVWPKRIYPGPEEFARSWALDRRFEPAVEEGLREERYAGWRDAVRRTLSGTD
jgi:glycerol kinase